MTGAEGGVRCAECGTSLAFDQRYCLGCGARRGPLPRAVERLLAGVGRFRAHGSGRPPEFQASGVREPARQPRPRGIPMPGPRAAGVATMTMLCFGVLVGSFVTPTVASQLARGPIVLVERAVTGGLAAPAPATLSGGDGGASGETRTITVTHTTPPPSTAGPAATAPPSASTTTTPARTGNGSGRGLLGLPPVKHVFLIVLGDQGFAQTFAPSTGDRYLSRTLARRGKVLEDFYAVAGSDLANEIALLSGQGPTPQTQANCPQFTPLTPGTRSAEGQVLGTGCVYPSSTQTLADQLAAKGLTWRAYVQGMTSPGAHPVSCAHPQLGMPDPHQLASASSPYATWRNPFVYFSSLLTGRACRDDDVDLSRLPRDLAHPRSTPAVSVILPDPCHDGSAIGCAPGVPAGLPEADRFLRSVIPQIMRSSAYKHGGLIAVTFAQAPQSGQNADMSGCCGNPSFPNLQSGGGSTTTTPSTTTTTPSTTTTVPSSTTTTVPSTTTTVPSSTTTTVPSTTTTLSTTTTVPSTSTTTPLTTTTVTTTTPAPATAPAGTTTAPSATTPGGGKVGLLLISSFVKPGSSDVVDPYDDFSLLATIENLFGLHRLGYAADPSLPVFDAGIFDARH